MKVEAFMRARYFAMIACFALASCSFAQAPANPSSSGDEKAVTAASIPPEQQATKEQLGKLFEVMRLRQQFEELTKMLPNLVQQQIHSQLQQMAASMPASKQMTPEQQAALDKLMKRYMEKASTLYPPDEMIDDAITVYQRHMRREDVEAYINFFSSPPGQHFLDVQPLIMKEYLPIAMERAQRRTKELSAEMAADLAEFERSVEPAK